MMTDRPVPDEFDAVVRDALADVAAAAHPDPGLADLLLATARAGGPAVVSLDARRHAKRWAVPLLAVASVVAVAVGVTAGTKLLADGSAPTLQHPSAPTPPAPAPTRPTAPHPATSQVSAPATPPALPGFHAADMYFSDPQHGWALGDARCASNGRPDCPALLATTDGGASWRPLSVPSGLVSTFDTGSCAANGAVAGPCVDAVAFADHSDGYLWSLHELYWTTDGGHSWSRYRDPAHAWAGAAQLVTAGGAVLRIAPVKPCSSGCPGTVETAPVGTTDWRPASPTNQQVGLYSSRLAVAGSDVYLFAGGDYTNPGAGIFRSTDGGRDWTHVASDVCGKAASPQQDLFGGAGSTVADNGALVAECLGPRYAGIRVAAPASGVFSPNRRFPTGRSELQAAQSQQRIVVADTAHAYGPGHVSTTFYATSDGGRTWQRTATIPARGDSLQFVSGTDGYALNPSGSEFYSTNDGGRTWHQSQFGS